MRMVLRTEPPFNSSFLFQLRQHSKRRSGRQGRYVANDIFLAKKPQGRYNNKSTSLQRAQVLSPYQSITEELESWKELYRAIWFSVPAFPMRETKIQKKHDVHEVTRHADGKARTVIQSPHPSV